MIKNNKTIVYYLLYLIYLLIIVFLKILLKKTLVLLYMIIGYSLKKIVFSFDHVYFYISFHN